MRINVKLLSFILLCSSLYIFWNIGLSNRANNIELVDSSAELNLLSSSKADENKKFENSLKPVNSSPVFKALLYKTPNELIERLRKIDLKNSSDAKYRLFSNLTELLKQKPDYCSDIVNQVLELDQSQDNYIPMLATIIGALASSKTIQAEKALVSILSNEENEKAALQAAIYLNNFPTPTLRSKGALAKILSEKPSNTDIYKGAALAYGSIASNLDSKNSNKIITDLIALAEKDVDNRKLYLSALGNSANQNALEFIEANLNSSESEVRSKAFFALRQIPGEDTLKVFESNFIKETKHEVLDSATNALRYFPKSEKYLKTVYKSYMAHERNVEISKSILLKSYLNLKEQSALDKSYLNLLEKLEDSCKLKHSFELIKQIKLELDKANKHD